MPVVVNSYGNSETGILMHSSVGKERSEMQQTSKKHGSVMMYRKSFNEG